MAGIHDLAKNLGVSTATVSRALNDKPGVSEETRRRVLEAAREMQYRPDSAARSLITTKTRTVLFVAHRHQFPPPKDPFYPHIMQGLEETLALQDYGVMLVTVDHDQLAAGPAALPALQERRADGVVLAGPDIPPGFVVATVASGIPVVLVDNALRETMVSAVVADNEGGCRAATTHLIETHGHEEVALLRGSTEWISSQERGVGYGAVMEDAGLEPHVAQMDDTTIETGEEALAQILAAKPETTAVVAVNDAMAIGAIKKARALGRRVPEDLAVVGFDDISWAALSDPPLTTVSVPTLEMGRVAARLLLDRWDGSLAVPSRTILAAQLVIRASCGCLPDRTTPERGAAPAMSVKSGTDPQGEG